jgi:F-type H+-transporting ATPase subunit b
MSPSVDMSPLFEGVTNSAPVTFHPVIAAVTVDFDKSVFLQMILFSLLIIVLKPLLFDPMLRVFALREEKTEGAKAEARAMQERAAEILLNYEKEVARVRAEATTERDNLRKETARVEAEILEQARAASEKIVSEGRAKLESEIAGLTSDLEKQTVALANELSRQVVGRELAP